MTPGGGEACRCAQIQLALPPEVLPIIVALNETQRGVHPLAALKMVPGDGNPVAVDIDRDLATNNKLR